MRILYNMVNIIWWRSPPCFFSWLLWPFSLIFRFLTFCRYQLYRLNVLKTTQFPIPVIVVGNIAVGGTGKTPLVIRLAQFFKEQGYHPGIVSRGYGRKNTDKIEVVTRESGADQVGDEPLLIKQHVDCPLVVAKNRVAAIHFLLHNFHCNLIISDDGLQHYAMGRQIEVVVVDAERQFGNGFCLPAGPLREPISRIKQANFVIYNGELQNKSGFCMLLLPGKMTNLMNRDEDVPLSKLNQKTVHAIAGIGNPKRFFDTLRELNMNVIEHPFPDHYSFKLRDLEYGENATVVMTEKDAVKCQTLGLTGDYWFLSSVAHVENGFLNKLLSKVKNGV